MNKINYNLSELTGIEYRLFYKVINGVNISKAVDEVVSENCYNNKKPQESTIIWKKYYPNVKKEIKCGIEIYDYTGKDYRTAMRFGSWRVAYLNHADRFDKANFEKVERHNEFGNQMFWYRKKEIELLPINDEDFTVLP